MMRLFTCLLLVVLLFPCASLTHAQAVAPAAAGQKVKAQAVQGTVQSVGAGSFTVLDKNGAVVTVYTDAATTYQLDKNPVTFGEAVRVGLSVKATLLPDGAASQVVSKSPATPNAPAAPKPATLDQLMIVLGATDEEWAVLRPHLESILSLQAQISAATVPLKTLTPSTQPDADTKAELTFRREARTKLTAQLAKSRAELIKFVTLRQELLLLQLGLVE
jgi:hypothetical protein